MVSEEGALGAAEGTRASDRSQQGIATHLCSDDGAHYPYLLACESLQPTSNQRTGTTTQPGKAHTMRLEISRGTQMALSTSDRVDRQTAARLEMRTLCETLRERIVGGVLPPDDAYWWTRIAPREVVATLGWASVS